VQGTPWTPESARRARDARGSGAGENALRIACLLASRPALAFLSFSRIRGPRPRAGVPSVSSHNQARRGNLRSPGTPVYTPAASPSCTLTPASHAPANRTGHFTSHHDLTTSCIRAVEGIAAIEAETTSTPLVLTQVRKGGVWCHVRRKPCTARPWRPWLRLRGGSR
jgi:hypothetical protein